MNQKKATKIITFVFVLPFTIISTPLLLIGVIMWPAIIFQMKISDISHSILNPGKWTIGELAPLTVPFGIWGLLTLWRLAIHFINNTHAPNKPGMKYLGLFFGSFAAVQLIVNVFSQTDRGGIWLGYIFILPLICTVYFVYLLIISDKKLSSAE